MSTIVNFEGQDAIDALVSVSSTLSITTQVTETSSTYSCEDAKTLGYEQKTGIGNLYWHALLYTGEPERLFMAVRFESDDAAEALAWSEAVAWQFSIDTGEPGEPAGTDYSYETGH